MKKRTKNTPKNNKTNTKNRRFSLFPKQTQKTQFKSHPFFQKKSDPNNHISFIFTKYNIYIYIFFVITGCKFFFFFFLGQLGKKTKNTNRPSRELKFPQKRKSGLHITK
jgi:hypothetical protein